MNYNRRYNERTKHHDIIETCSLAVVGSVKGSIAADKLTAQWNKGDFVVHAKITAAPTPITVVDLSSKLSKKEKKSVWDKKYYIRQREKMKADSKKYYKENKVALRAKAIIYCAKNKDAVAARTKKWRDVNKVELAKKRKARYQAKKIADSQL